KAARLRLMQLRVDGTNELLVLGRALGPDPVANDDLLHCETSLIRSVVVLAGAPFHSPHASASSAGTGRSMPVAVGLRRRRTTVGRASRPIAPQTQKAHWKPPVSAAFTVLPSPVSVLKFVAATVVACETPHFPHT